MPTRSKTPARRAPAGLDPEAVAALLQRAADGDATCVPELRELFRDPSSARLVERYGSPPQWLRNALVTAWANERLDVREAAFLKLAEVRRELEGPNPTPPERLLAERAALCWWIVHSYEFTNLAPKERTLAQAEYHQRKIDRAHNRFLSALKTLATVRKLALPALQVNIAASQTNILRTSEA